MEEKYRSDTFKPNTTPSLVNYMEMHSVKHYKYATHHFVTMNAHHSHKLNVNVEMLRNKCPYKEHSFGHDRSMWKKCERERNAQEKSCINEYFSGSSYAVMMTS